MAGALQLDCQLGDDLSVLVRALCVPLVEIASLSGAGYPGYEPTAVRLRFADGQVLKGRVFESAARAALVEFILQQVQQHRGFPRVVARSGPALLSEWVDGQTLAAVACSADLLRECGGLQAYLHRTPIPANAPYKVDGTMRGWRPSVEGRLQELVAAGALAEREAQDALQLAHDHAPASSAVGFVHGDLCAENIVRRPSGEVCVVDNETLSFDACDYDLGRTWYRWPMQRHEREAYWEGYEHYRSCAEFVAHFPYWAIVATVDGAAFRIRKQPAAVQAPLRTLRRLIGDLAAGLPTADAMFRC